MNFYPFTSQLHLPAPAQRSGIGHQVDWAQRPAFAAHWTVTRISSIVKEAGR